MLMCEFEVLELRMEMNVYDPLTLLKQQRERPENSGLKGYSNPDAFLLSIQCSNTSAIRRYRYGSTAIACGLIAD